VVVFVSPNQVDQPDDPNPSLVKRLVAVAGDTVWMRGGVFHVNGMAQRQGFPASENPKGDGGFSHPLFGWQKPFEIRGTAAGDPPAQPTLDDWGPLVVPANFLFMLGDNRYDSKDGRYWGFVPRENVRGRPVFVYYSYNADESTRPLPFLTDIRWGRIGTILK
jgi:signal peptidase I